MSSNFFGSHHFLWGQKRNSRTSDEISRAWSARESASLSKFNYENRVAIRMLIYGVVGDETLRWIFDGLLLPPPFAHTDLDAIEWTAELLSGVVQMIPSELDVAIIFMPLFLGCRMGAYDSRLRAASRRLCSMLALPFYFVEKEEELIVHQAISTVEQQKDSKNSSVSWRRAITIGGFAVVGGVALTVTGGLAAPLMAPAYGAVVSGVSASIGAIGSFGTAILGGTGLAAGIGTMLGAASQAAALGGLLTPVLTAANVTAIFGVSGAGLAGYKAYRRTGSNADFRLRRVGGNSFLSAPSSDGSSTGEITSAYAKGSLSQTSLWKALTDTGPQEESSKRDNLPGLCVPFHLCHIVMGNVATLPLLRKRFRQIIFSIECRISFVDLKLKAFSVECGVWAVEPPSVIPAENCGVFASVNRFGRPTGTAFIVCFIGAPSKSAPVVRKTFRLWVKAAVDVLGFYSFSTFCEPSTVPFNPTVASSRLATGKTDEFKDFYAAPVIEEGGPLTVLKLVDQSAEKNDEDKKIDAVFPASQLSERGQHLLKQVKSFRRSVGIAVTNKSLCIVKFLQTNVRCGCIWPTTPVATESLDLDYSSLNFFTNSKWSVKGVEVMQLIEIKRIDSENVPIFLRLDVEVTAMNNLTLSVQGSPNVHELKQMEVTLSAPAQKEFNVQIRGISHITVTVRVLTIFQGVEVIIQDGLNVQCDRPALTVAVSGYIGIFDPRRPSDDQQLALWEPVVSHSHHFRSTESYVLQWEQTYQTQFAEAIHANLFSADLFADNATGLAKRVAKKTVMQGTLFNGFLAYQAFLGSMTLPLSALWAIDSIDNAYSALSHRAADAGKNLAAALLSSRGLRPTSLVGFSFGAAVICHCLLELYERKSFGVIENVFLVGCTFSAGTEEWGKMRQITAGRFVNVYSTKDWMLWMMEKANASFLTPVAGLTPVRLPGIENVDATHICPHHSLLATKLADILASIEEFPTESIIEKRYSHGASGIILAHNSSDYHTISSNMYDALLSTTPEKVACTFSVRNFISAAHSEGNRIGVLKLNKATEAHCFYAYDPPSQIKSGETAVFGACANACSEVAGCFCLDFSLWEASSPVVSVLFFFYMNGAEVKVGVETLLQPSDNDIASFSKELDFQNICQRSKNALILEQEPLKYKEDFNINGWFDDGDGTCAVITVRLEKSRNVVVCVSSLLLKGSSLVERNMFTSEQFKKGNPAVHIKLADGMPRVAPVEKVELLQSRLEQLERLENFLTLVVANCGEGKLLLEEITTEEGMSFKQLPPAELESNSFSIVYVAEEMNWPTGKNFLFRYVLEDDERGYNVFVGKKEAHTTVDCESFKPKDEFTCSENSLRGVLFYMVLFSPEQNFVSNTEEWDIKTWKIYNDTS